MYNKDSLKNSTLAELRKIAEELKLEGYERILSSRNSKTIRRN